MSDRTLKIYPAHVAGVMAIAAAAAGFFIHPLISVVFLLFYIVLCVAACFLPQMNFLGPVISRGRSGKKAVALTFDDGPCAETTPRILDLLDRYQVKATFFVSGIHALQFPELIREIIRRGHAIGNHSLNHDPLVALKGYRRLYREVAQARDALKKMGADTLAFRPPVGIINPMMPSVLSKLGLFCVTFSCRARDAGNRFVKNLAGNILKKVKADDIILLHDRPPHCAEDEAVFWQELEKIMSGIRKKGLQIVPLSELIGKEIMPGEMRARPEGNRG